MEEPAPKKQKLGIAGSGDEEPKDPSSSPRVEEEKDNAGDISAYLDTSSNVELYEKDDELSLVDAIELRMKYMIKSRQCVPKTVLAFFDSVNSDDSDILVNLTDRCTMSMDKGIMRIFHPNNGELFKNVYPSEIEFLTDISLVIKLMEDYHARSFCSERLNNLKSNFEDYKSQMSSNEKDEQKIAPLDYHTIPKVDAHVHAGRSMTQQLLLNYIKKISKSPDWADKAVCDGMTLIEVFNELSINPDNLNMDQLDVLADQDTYQDMHCFNRKGKPCGKDKLRKIFLKPDNDTEGEFFAEILKETVVGFEKNNEYAEYRLSITGSKEGELDTLATWAVKWMLSDDNILKRVRWLIQVPRNYHCYRKKDKIGNFQEMIDNIFRPLFEVTNALFEVTNDPDTHPELNKLLPYVVGFDSVDDESELEPDFGHTTLTPDGWASMENPPYSYYLYYMYANLAVLNAFRTAKGLNTFAFRPHCVEAGDVKHLAAGFLLAQSIAHGVNLQKTPVLQYLYYCCQIGLHMSPLSNDKLFVKQKDNPFPDFFAKGLNVSLSTDDPLQFHMMEDPLWQEYVFAKEYYELNSADLCELARNSVLQSGFPHEMKMDWLDQITKKREPTATRYHAQMYPTLESNFATRTSLRS